MTPSEEKLEKHLRSGYAAAAIAAVALILLFPASDVARPFVPSLQSGLVFPSPNLWWPQSLSDLFPWVPDVIAIVMQAVGALMLLAANTRYKFVRTTSLTYVALALWLQIMTPGITTELNGGAFTPAVMLGAAMLMMSAYKRPRSTMPVCLAFALVSTCSLFERAFLPLLITMFLGLGALRIFRIRAILASIFGAAAPWWVLFCLGVEFTPPAWLIPFPRFYAGMGHGELIHLCVAMGFSILSGIGMTALNMMYIIRCNSRARAYMVFFVLISFCVSVMVAASPAALLPLLNVMVAIQAGYLLTAYPAHRITYLAVSGLIICPLILYVWSLWV